MYSMFVFINICKASQGKQMFTYLTLQTMCGWTIIGKEMHESFYNVKETCFSSY